MNLKARLNELRRGDWSEEEIEALNSKRMTTESIDWIRSSTKIDNAGSGAAALIKALSGRNLVIGSVGFAAGIGMVMVASPDSVKTETGRIITIDGLDLEPSDRKFFPLYDRGVDSSSEEWKKFVIELCCNSTFLERDALYGKRWRQEVSSNWDYFECIGRPMIQTTSAGGNNYCQPGCAFLLNHGSIERLWFSGSKAGLRDRGNSPSFREADIRTLTEEEAIMMSQHPWFIDMIGGIK